MSGSKYQAMCLRSGKDIVERCLLGWTENRFLAPGGDVYTVFNHTMRSPT